jgi:hypothetical protein
VNDIIIFYLNFKKPKWNLLECVRITDPILNILIDICDKNPFEKIFILVEHIKKICWSHSEKWSHSDYFLYFIY